MAWAGREQWAAGQTERGLFPPCDLPEYMEAGAKRNVSPFAHDTAGPYLGLKSGQRHRPSTLFMGGESRIKRDEMLERHWIKKGSIRRKEGSRVP